MCFGFWRSGFFKRKQKDFHLSSYLIANNCEPKFDIIEYKDTTIAIQKK